MMDSLRVVGVDSSIVRHDVLFDGYVPLCVSSYSEPIGAGFLRLGDYSTTLLELTVEPHVQRVRGATLTSLGGLEAWPEVGVRRAQPGSPILNTTFSGYRVDDLAVEFRVAAGEHGILIFWEALEDCEACESGRVRFLVAGGFLAGIWCTHVTKEERELFRTAAGI
jgi:hypothetical protein